MIKVREMELEKSQINGRLRSTWKLILAKVLKQAKSGTLESFTVFTLLKFGNRQKKKITIKKLCREHSFKPTLCIIVS